MKNKKDYWLPLWLWLIPWGLSIASMVILIIVLNSK